MTDEPIDPRIRLVDRCAWAQHAFIDNNGLPRHQITPPLFVEVVLPARIAIVKAMLMRPNEQPWRHKP